jgi:hypothetical protein
MIFQFSFETDDIQNVILFYFTNILLQGWCGKNQSGKYGWFLPVFTTK